MRILANLAIFVLIVLISGGLALLSLNPLGNMGVFGSCFEGGCGYAAIFLGLPVITAGLTLVGCVIWFMLARRR